MLILALIMSAVAAAGYFLGGNISLLDSWPYFEALRTTSAIVFGVMGALLAIVFPEAIKQGFRTPKSPSGVSADNISRITDPLAQSALLLVILVILGPVVAWGNTAFPAGSESAVTVQSAAFSLLCVLSAWQVLILVLVLRPLDLLRTHFTTAKAKADMRARIHHSGSGD